MLLAGIQAEFGWTRLKHSGVTVLKLVFIGVHEAHEVRKTILETCVSFVILVVNDTVCLIT